MRTKAVDCLENQGIKDKERKGKELLSGVAKEVEDGRGECKTHEGGSRERACT